MSPLTFSIIRQSTQLSTARCGVLAMNVAPAGSTEGHDTTTKDRRIIETPGCFMYSVKGSVPHLTPDTLRLQGFNSVNVSMEQLLQDQFSVSLDKWPFTLSKFLNLQDLILLCDLRDPSSFVKVPFNSDRHVSMISQQGVRQLSLEDYLKVVRVYRPDIVGSFSDSISDTKEPGLKRVQKSVDRSLKWLDQALMEREGKDGLAQDRAADEKKRLKSKTKENKENKENKEPDVKTPIGARMGEDALPNKTITTQPWTEVGLFAHVQGSQFEQERIRSAQETAKRTGVDGYIVDANALPGSKDEILHLLKASLDHLPKEKPRLVYGVQTPEDVLRSVELGVDLFDTTYPFLLTEDGKASLYTFGATSSSAATDSIDSTSAAPEESNVGQNNKRWINLWDDEHADKFVPIMEGCECYACKGGRHTRAYINHLLKAHEMLATVLLMSHNMHQYSKFFTNIRQSIVDGSFVTLSEQFRKQFGTEPERTGEIHEAQRVLEASLSKRNRNDSSEGKANTTVSKTPIVADATEVAAQNEARQRQMVNKKQMRAQKLKDRELSRAQRMALSDHKE
ncbi:Queuine tRNA-ribosyltransferase subunit qtrtd1 [Podila epigama]|nr:Queuine tRNA-ribosyltransferase subunit qtrtd1 [Podila epigama]